MDKINAIKIKNKQSNELIKSSMYIWIIYYSQGFFLIIKEWLNPTLGLIIWITVTFCLTLNEQLQWHRWTNL
jgi:hypothetical protein